MHSNKQKMKQLLKEQALEIVKRFQYSECYVDELTVALISLYNGVMEKIRPYINKDNTIADIKALYLDNLNYLIEDLFIDVETGDMELYNVLEDEAYYQQKKGFKTWKDELFDIIINGCL